MKTSSLERKDPDVSWLSVRLLVKVEFAVYSLSFELMFMNDTFSNLKTYLPSALKHPFGCHFKHL